MLLPTDRWLEGPYCRLCNVTDGSRYYDAAESECLVCGEDAAGKVAIMISGVLIVALVVSLLVLLRPDRKIKCLVRLAIRFKSMYTRMSFRAK